MEQEQERCRRDRYAIIDFCFSLTTDTDTYTDNYTDTEVLSFL